MTVCDFFFVQNDLGHFLIVFTVFGVNYVVAQFAKIVISCYCILNFERSGSMILLVNDHLQNILTLQRQVWGKLL